MERPSPAAAGMVLPPAPAAAAATKVRPALALFSTISLPRVILTSLLVRSLQGFSESQTNSSLSFNGALAGATVLFVVVVFLIIAILIWRRKRREKAAASRIQTMKFKFSRSEQVESPTEEAECSICLMEYGEEEDLGVLACGHKYHAACIGNWVRVSDNVNCPICRADV